MEKTIEIQNLVKKYGENTALDNISFNVDPGSCFGLLGPNGAGKSTTMKILAGISEPDSGFIRVLGLESRVKKTQIKKRVGYVPQEITLYEKLNADYNLRFFGELYGLSGKELKERINEVLKQVGLLDHAGSVINTFSGGMKRRINIAAALMHQPKLLILDEPTVGIDPQSRNHIFGIIRELKNSGVTVIYSTHYMEEAEALCDELAIIDHGKVIAMGTVGDILDKHTRNAVYLETDETSEIPAVAYSTDIFSQNRGWIIETSNVLGTIQDIVQRAQKENINVKELEIVRPSLENVFLSLTGTSLRD